MISVLFVCTGNICRSPTAEGVFRALIEQHGLSDRIMIDSAGLYGYHIGEAPDHRSIKAAQARGYDISGLRARRVRPSDYSEFDLILAMDRGHYREMIAACPPANHERIRMFLDFAPGFNGADVPDPYYGQADGFDRVLDMAEAGANGMLTHLRPLL